VTTERDRYFDTLRAVAIIRVVFFHAFPVAALELVFPSMGVMFALGGSLMVKSLDRNAGRAVRNRVRRLLPALWAMAAVLVPLMFLHGWADRPAWPRLLLWLVPVATPPHNNWDYGFAAAGVLWYLVTYLWLVLLSPVLLKLYRRWSLTTVLLPLVGLAVLVFVQNPFGDTAGTVVQNVLAYGSCWVLGMAHREGDLARLRPGFVIGVGTACVAGALAWAYTHPTDHGVDLTSVPLAYAIYAIGFVLVLLRWSPRMGWLGRIRPLNGFVSMVNNRAVTIYLWHNVAITAAVFLFDPLKLWRIPTQGLEDAVDFGLALTMLLVAVLALGWVEDVAARRRPRVSPFVKRPKPEPELHPARGMAAVPVLAGAAAGGSGGSWPGPAADPWAGAEADPWTAQAADSRPAQAADSWPAQAANPWPAQTANPWPAQTANPWPAQTADSWPAQAAEAQFGQSSGSWAAPASDSWPQQAPGSPAPPAAGSWPPGPVAGSWPGSPADSWPGSAARSRPDPAPGSWPPGPRETGSA
jgi:peptidoglycan/LPS O-acetylase OafA/YrhL